MATAVSAGVGVWFLVKARKLERKLEKLKDVEQLMEFAMLQQDLNTFGGGIVKIQRLDPSNLFYKSPTV